MRLLLAVALIALLSPTSALAEDPPAFLLKWGSTGTGDGQFDQPLGMGVDQSGNIYVVDNELHRVQKFSGTGQFLGKFGTDGAGPGQLHLPVDAAIASNGDIYVSDYGNSRIQVFNSTFAFVRQWPAAIGSPESLALDPGGQYLYSTTFDGRIVQYLLDGTFQRTWTYDAIALPNSIGFAVGSSGSIYIAGFHEDVVRKYSASGQLIDEWGEEGHAPGQLFEPLAVAVDANENVYVSDADRRVQKFTTDGVLLTGWGSEGSDDGQFMGGVTDLAIDPNNNVFALEPQRDLIHKFGAPSTPTRSTTWGRLKKLYR